jgi:hypothetical protein
VLLAESDGKSALLPGSSGASGDEPMHDIEVCTFNPTD